MNETSCNMNKRIYEHRRDLKRVDINNGKVKHNLKTNHNFNFKVSNSLVNIRNKMLENCWIFYHFKPQ